jgi:hypothetical protein
MEAMTIPKQPKIKGKYFYAAKEIKQRHEHAGLPLHFI